jgi:protein-tyrosine phosphatase
MNERILAWDGCVNVRDLGGLRAADGRVTCWGAVVRSDTPARLSETGWAALHAYGIRTIVTLHTHGMDEEALNVVSPYPGIALAQVEIEDITDQDFLQRWAKTGLWATPLYYRDALRRWPERHAAVVSAVARAQPGGVLFHCVRGNDRTGIAAVLLLALAGVEVDDICADYLLSPDRTRDEALASGNISARDAIASALDGLAIDDYLLQGGASREDLDVVRKRMVG